MWKGVHNHHTPQCTPVKNDWRKRACCRLQLHWSGLGMFYPLFKGFNQTTQTKSKCSTSVHYYECFVSKSKNNWTVHWLPLQIWMTIMDSHKQWQKQQVKLKIWINRLCLFTALPQMLLYHIVVNIVEIKNVHKMPHHGWTVHKIAPPSSLNVEKIKTVKYKQWLLFG